MNIALIGSGGREHALCQKIYQSKLSKNIICIPVWELTIAKNVKIDYLNFKKLLKTLRLHSIDLVIVGPEEPLVKGIVDFLRKIKLKFLDQINMQQNLKVQKLSEVNLQRIKFRLRISKYVKISET